MPKAKARPKRPATKAKAAITIAEKAMPGWKAVNDEELLRPADADTPPDAVLPPLAELRRKYLGDTAAAMDAPAEDAATEDDTEVVTMQSGPLRKKVGVKDGVIKWSQG